MAVTDCIRTCRGCGAEFRRAAKGQPTKYCGIDCRDRAQHGWKGNRKTHNLGGHCSVEGCSASATTRGLCHNHYQRSRKGIELTKPPVYVKGARTRKCCGWCGEEMVLRPSIAKRTTYCSRRCLGLAFSAQRKGPNPVCPSKLRRRVAVRFGDRIDRVKVFERDKWRCHLCGIKTPERLIGANAPRSPELDHIVTLADGGSHTWGNVACACRRCNGLKGARSSGQLSLSLAA